MNSSYFLVKKSKEYSKNVINTYVFVSYKKSTYKPIQEGIIAFA
jgi:hypothetical protein